MSQTITAVYADGVLRPLSPLNLPEETQVELEMRPVASVAAHNQERKQFIEALAQAGLLANEPSLFPFPEEPLSDEEQQDLARLFAGEKPLSQIIIEERQKGW